MAGRKSKAEELKIIERYAELTEPFFKVLKEALEGKNKRDKHWAIEQLSKGFVKMIPQKLGNDPDNPLPTIPIYAGLSKKNEENAIP